MDGQLCIPAHLSAKRKPHGMQDVRLGTGKFLDAKEGVKIPSFSKIKLQILYHPGSRIVNENRL